MPAFPEGRYLSCLDTIHPDHSGQTRASLMRNRLLRSHAGIDATLLTFDAVPDYEQRRQVVVDRGLVHPDTQILNIFDSARDDPGSAGEEGHPLQDLSDLATRTECRLDGTPWRIRYVDTERNQTCFDYLRADGTPCLRVPEYFYGDHRTWPDDIKQISPNGTVVAEFGSLGDWFRHWVCDLTTHDDPAFVFLDSRHLVPHLVPLPGPGKYLIYVLHNLHVRAPGRWDSPAFVRYEQMMSRIGDMDALVTLTARQGADLAERCGKTNNLFVVPNPVDLPPAAKDAQRDPLLATMFARLEPQKRLDHAIAAFGLVTHEVPQARLDIYGVGSQRTKLGRDIKEAGLEGRVTLRGFDPEARNSLWKSSVFLLTSRYEGYPLSTLESFSHACPVVSYDIKYGPREQITDGIDGFLVPDGDVAQIADRVVTLLGEPERAREMGAAALTKAMAHGPQSFLRDWAQVFEAIVAQKPARCTIDGAELEVKSVVVGRAVELSAVLRADIPVPLPLLRKSRVELDLVNADTGTVVSLPVVARRRATRWQITCSAQSTDFADRADGAGRDGASYLRLRLVVANSVWQTRVDT